MNHRFHPSETHHSFGASAGLEVPGMNGFNQLQAEAYSWGRDHHQFRPHPPFPRHEPPCPGLPNLGFNNPYNNLNQGYNNFNQGYNNFNQGYNNFNQGYNNFDQGYNNFNPGYNNYNPLPPGCTAFSIPQQQQQQFGANNYYDGVNVGTSSFAGNPLDGAAAWGASNPYGSNMGGVGWGTDSYGRTHGSGSMTFVGPDGSVGRAVLHSANGQGELDWKSSTGSGVIKWGPGYCNSYSLPLNPYNQRDSW